MVRGGQQGATEDRRAAARGTDGLAEENRRLREAHGRATRYIREKINQLLGVMGTAPLRPEELDEQMLIELDPIGIVAQSFAQILGHLNRTNEQLRFAREELQAIFDSAGFGILVIDRDLRVLACNAQFRRQFGIRTGDTHGEICASLACGFEEPQRQCPFTRVFTTGETYHRLDWVVKGVHFDIVGTPIRNAEGEVTSIVLVYADITERLRAEEAVRRSEERYRDLFENANDLIISLRLDGSIEYVNHAWCETLGYDCAQSARLSIFDLLHPECAEECRGKFASMIGDGGGGRIHAALVSREGRKIVVDGDVRAVFEGGRPVGVRGILRDITEQERLEEELLKREKLESVGLLAGGIAHDFNNILTAVLGNISLAMLYTRPGQDLHARLEEAEKASLSARELTQQLLTFAKGGAPVRRVTSLAQLLRDRSAFALRGSGVRLELEIAPDLRATEIDEGQIGQVVHNLVLNAVQAMPGGGTVRVSAENHDADGSREPLIARGPHVRISVRDAGCGIPRENLQRMFDPYFTTKAGGTGLGLAISYSIVKKHDGHIRVESEPGRGTTFEVYLPASDAPAPPPRKDAAAPGHGRGRVLLMDDELIVRTVATDLLREIGYEVECAAEGGEALRRYEEALRSGMPFDAVVMDLTIPGGMGGKEAIRRLLELHPQARAVVSSGYSNDPIMAQYREHGFRGVIAKPYRLHDLAEVLNAVVGAPPAGRRGASGPERLPRPSAPTA